MNYIVNFDKVYDVRVFAEMIDWIAKLEPYRYQSIDYDYVWTVKHGGSSETWKFARENDALLFALKFK